LKFTQIYGIKIVTNGHQNERYLAHGNSRRTTNLIYIYCRPKFAQSGLVRRVALLAVLYSCEIEKPVVSVIHKYASNNISNMFRPVGHIQGYHVMK